MSKVILVTGASSGLGKALGEFLQQSGYKVYGTSRRGSQPGTSFSMLPMDVTKEDSIHRAVQYIIDREGRIDVLVNNAGVGMGAPLEKVDIADARQLFDTNFFGVLRVCQAVLPHMRKTRDGQIFHISSIGGTVGLPYRGIYCASKAALDMLSETLRMEVKPFHIEVTSIQAGDMATPIKSNWIGNYTGEDDTYGPSFKRVVEAAGQEVDAGTSPEAVARQIEKIIRRGNLNKAYPVGKPVQRLSLLAKRLLPASWFERIIMRYSGLS
jgi:NAD(P)-dependent dehydrogenase (short-subunit alcohol dehydrogenase family)